MSEKFNLSGWALRHQTLILFFMLIMGIAGILSYIGLGRQEDPDFTIKTVVIQAFWPGATAREMELQVTDKLEKKLQELAFFDNSVSYSKPGETLIKLTFADYTPPKEVPSLFYQLRKKLGDIQRTLPTGVQGPFVNDEFGDTFGIIYAFAADGFTQAELKHYVENVRQQLLTIKLVGKVELYGTQDEKIFVEFSHAKLATLGISPNQIFDALQRQAAMAPSALVETPKERISLRIDNGFDTLDDVRNVPIVANGRVQVLGDIAEVRRGYEDPMTFQMRFNGKQVIGLGLSMEPGGNIIDMGREVDAMMKRIKTQLPYGIEIEQVAAQPKVVDASISEFVKSLGEALAIVLAVSFISLGFRTGIVVALSVPLVLTITFLIMSMTGINLHRISLGALIIALGLLVDDAIIAVEMMMLKLEEGYDRVKAATFAFSSTAFPMLTGTIVTAAGFVPVGFAKSAVAEYTNAIFWVTAIALGVSWVVAVLFTPYLGYKLLPEFKDRAHGGHDPHDTRLYRALRAVVTFCVRWRKSVLVVTLGIFIASVIGFGKVAQQFFPSASRPELMVDVRLPGGSAIAATQATVERVEALLKDDPNVAFYASYVGAGTPRFYLPTNPELRQSNFGQFVIMTKGLHEREIVFEKLQKAFAEEFPEGLLRVARLENGPPVGFPVQFRVIGSDPAQIREIAYKVRDAMRANPHTANVNLEWNELSKTVRLEVDHKKARALGVNPQDLSTTLYTLLSGLNVAQFHEGTELISVVARAIPAERLSLTDLEGINVGTSNGGAISLAQIATVKYELEEPVLWRRNLETMINVRADIWDGVQAPVVTAQINPQLDLIRATLPDGYRIDVGGAVEESAKGQNSINAMMPVMMMIMVTTLMIQLQSFQRLIIVLLTAPLGLIGVAAALLITGMPFGFVATLGTIALAGMIMRNSVILVDQIEQDVRAGHALWDAIIDATVRRARPIALTAAAAILAMVPLSFSAFWGPMAVSIMGGLTVATLLTLLFLPALYAAWFRAKPVQAEEEDPSQDIRRRALAHVPALAAPGVPSNRPAE